MLAIPPGVADELTLVDDASRDGTAELAAPSGSPSTSTRTTVGTAAIRSRATGWRSSPTRTSWSYSTRTSNTSRRQFLVTAPIVAGDADVTFGSRFAGMGDPLGGGYALYRYLGNRLTTVAQNLGLGTRFTDMHSGMRAYTPEPCARSPSSAIRTASRSTRSSSSTL